MDTTPEEILRKHTGLFSLRFPEVYKTAVLDAMREYGEIKQSPRWVKVEDGLPKEGEWVLVWGRAKAYKDSTIDSIMVARRMDIGFVSYAMVIEATHWMPLPIAPDESESSKNRLGEIVGKWPGDEPLEETLKGVSESPKEEAVDPDFTLWVVANKWQYHEGKHRWLNDYISECNGMRLTHAELYTLFKQTK